MTVPAEHRVDAKWAAARLGVSVQAVHDMRRKAQLRGERDGTGRTSPWTFDQRDVERLADHRECAAPPVFIPTAERSPQGLDPYWLGVWRHALSLMKQQGTWGWELKPLLDEYVYALRAAEATRDGFEWLDALEAYAEKADDLPEIAWSALAQIAGNLPAQWDRHTKRAAMLADKLILTPEARKRHGIFDEEDDESSDPFAGVDRADELAQRRRAS